jgi:glycosyltransferase involved in cell wall biosynthesis
MSMAVAPWLPRNVPLTVGTHLIRQAAVTAGHRHVALLEPPVDTEADNPLVEGEAFRLERGVRRQEILVAMICRLVPDLKLEGLLSTCEAVQQLVASGYKVRLMIAGDGRARDQIVSRATSVNSIAGHEVIFLTGELANPAEAYAAADIIVGQGGSALRGMAFAKPLIVIGENGFSELLTPATASTFLRQGWYGLGPGSLGSGVSALRRALEVLINSPEMRDELGLFGRRLAEERFGLNHAAGILEEIYRSAVKNGLSLERPAGDFVRSTAGLITNKLRRRYQRWSGTALTDDCNARDLVASILRSDANSEQNVTP